MGYSKPFRDGHHIGQSQSLTHSRPVMPMTVLICGGPVSGFQIIGLFANSADAQSFAEDYRLAGCRDNITEGICRKPSGVGLEVPSLTDFRNRFFSPPSSSKDVFRRSSAAVATSREGRHS
jgi:hypothetical protein